MDTTTSTVTNDSVIGTAVTSQYEDVTGDGQFDVIDVAALLAET